MIRPILALLFILLISCSKSDDNTNLPEEPSFRGTIHDIEEYYSPELVKALQNLGFVFHLGNTPPNIEGIYEASPLIIQASSTGRDNVGNRLADQIISLSNQNNDGLTIDFKIEGNGQTTFGKGSFISGNTDEFSIFIKSETKNDNSITVETATAITGKMDETGILNFQFAGLMQDDKGDPDNLYIENNTGRLIYDSDEFSPLVEPPADKSFEHKLKSLSYHDLFSINTTN